MGAQDKKKSRLDTAGDQLNGFLAFMWNGEKREFMGRNARSWVEILAFYIVFYSILASMWVGALYVKCIFLPEIPDGPLYSDYLSHRGPGLNIVPGGVMYSTSNNLSQAMHNKQLEIMLKEYQLINEERVEELRGECVDTTIKCNDDGGYRAGIVLPTNTTENNTIIETIVDRVGVYSLANLGPCLNSKDITDNTENGSPCLYLRVNKVFGWTPSKEIPDSKKDRAILAAYQEEGGELDEDFNPIYCRGYKGDKGRVSVDVFPKKGIRRDMFPLSSDPRYRSPVVAVRVTPHSDKGYNRELRIECMLLADNVHQNSQLIHIGRVLFKLRVNKDEGDNLDNVTVESTTKVVNE